ncbi:hypothetical protein [Streptomyces fructofermentans]|uniref:Uncharacterized protein n=1 Tax=Streptomyces fructofermentans TaxID=152141 RepID=A0A918NAY3_9ACTN|nr:hypothetical protein [Streptomyces fructofermentans]GGX59252.1 hypothetical protein GCM10010515_28970 [Streptomyces fructofermentans]
MARVSVVIVAGPPVGGALLFLAMLRFDRQAPETDPGEAGAFSEK